MEPTERSGSQPGGSALGVSQRGGLLRASRQRKARGSLRQRGIAQRHQDGKAVQPRAVQLAESSRQQGVVVVRRLWLRDGRGTPPSCIGARASECVV